MPLRVATLAPSKRVDVETPHEWRRRVDRFELDVQAAIAARRPEQLASTLEQLQEWTDAHRAFQARCRAVGALLQSGTTGPWIELFSAAADHLLTALDENPNEPVLLNLVGVLLFEVGETAAGEALFRAALKLDPTLPFAAANLKQARARKRAGLKIPPQVAARTRPLGARGRRIAAAAAPAAGLTISLCMIVKDEEEMLPGCLEAVAEGVDEIVIVDTGSTDRTVEIAESFGARVIHFPWNGSFADARNVGLDAATGDWLFYLDADEHLVEGDAARIRELLGHTWREGFHLVETNYTGGEDAGTSVTHMALRIFRNRPQYRFEGRIHEQKTQHMPTYLPERFEATTIRVRHYGYLKSRISAKEKSRRNIELLEQEARETPSAFNSFNLGSEYLMLDDAATAAKHFDRAWQELHAGGDWTAAGYAPILASRAALARRASGRIADAREVLAVAIAAMPDHTDLHLELALCARADGDLAEAERLARHCLELGDAPAQYAAVAGSGTYLALCLLGELAEERHDDTEAERCYLEALAQFPDYVAPVLPATTLLAKRGADLVELRESLPLDRPSACLLAATACLEHNRLDDAETLFTEVLERQSGNDAARIGLAETFLSGCRWAEAAEAAAAVPAESPLASAAEAEVVFAHAAAGDTAALAAALAEAEALTAGERALYDAWAAAIGGKPLPTSLVPAALTPAATALEALLRVQEFETFGRLVAVGERIAVARDDWREVLAQMYLRRGYLDSAADEWIASVQERPTARAFVGLAQVALARSLDEDAVVFARHALELEPANPEAQRVVDALRARVAA